MSRGNFRGKRQHYNKNKGQDFNRKRFQNVDKVDQSWLDFVKKNNEAVDLKFEDYDGQKIHNLPENFLKLLNEENIAENDFFFTEVDYGITQYLGKHKGFNGILKHRITDFVVHEIGLNSEVIRLTNYEIPEDDELKQLEDGKVIEFKDLEQEEQRIIGALSFSRMKQLSKKGVESLAKSIVENNSVDFGDVKIDVTNKSKEERKEYHALVKKYFPILDSNTSDIDNSDKKYIVVKVKKMGSQNSKQWPRDRPKHLTFHLCKKNMDNNSLIGQLARAVSLHPSKFSVAGTKDKRAITTQRFSVPLVSAKKMQDALKGINRLNHQKGAIARVKIGNFSYEKTNIELGALQGNLFTIVLRNLREPSEIADEALKSLRSTGFVNYFGHQRFGTDSTVKTSDIGLALIKSQWETAAELILKPRPNESSQMTRMRAHWWMYRKPADAVVLLGNGISQSKSLEASLLHGLANSNQNDYLRAFSHLQRNTVLLYLHAYQSLIWNKVVSERIKRFGDQVLIGDTVLMSQPENKNTKTEKEGEEESTVAAVTTMTTTKEFETKLERKIANIETVDENNISRYTLHDVVMPIPGHKVPYPKNEELKEIYLSLMKEDGLDQGFEGLKHKTDMFSLSGDYRVILQKVNDLSWRFISHSEPDEDILVSDFDIIDGKQPKESVQGGEYQSLLVEFSLNSSTYATMALREAMKIDLGKGSQSMLTEKYKTLIEEKRKRKIEENNEEKEECIPAVKKIKSDNESHVEDDEDSEKS